MITGSIQPKNGKWQMVINMPMSNGKTKQKWRSTGLPVKGNKRKAQNMLDKQLAELNKYDVPYNEITVAEYFVDWLKAIKIEVKPNTYRNYCGNMNNHIIPYFREKGIKLQDLKPYDIEEYYKHKERTNSRCDAEGKISNSTIKHHHQNISKALSDALRKDLIRFNPAMSVKPPKCEKYNANYLNTEETEKLIDYFKDSVISVPVTLCAFYGLRRSEALGIKWQNVDFEKREFTICETLQQHVGGNYTDTPKTQKSYRTLPLTESMCVFLSEHKKHQEECKRELGERYINEDNYVCTHQNGRIITPNYLSKKFHAGIVKGGFPAIRLHDLRHSVATNAIGRGVPITNVSALLGHSNISTTLDIYSHATKTWREDVANTLESMINIRYSLDKPILFSD